MSETRSPVRPGRARETGISDIWICQRCGAHNAPHWWVCWTCMYGQGEPRPRAVDDFATIARRMRELANRR